MTAVEPCPVTGHVPSCLVPVNAEFALANSRIDTVTKGCVKKKYSDMGDKLPDVLLALARPKIRFRLVLMI